MAMAASMPFGGSPGRGGKQQQRGQNVKTPYDRNSEEAKKSKKRNQDDEDDEDWEDDLAEGGGENLSLGGN